MISNINSNYAAICKLFEFGRKNHSEETKRKLLRMAKSKKKKPSVRTKLGLRLHNYTKKSSSCYDKDFTSKLRLVNSSWLLSQFEIANMKKQKLLEMAKNGEPRPKKGVHPLGANLGSYTNKSQGPCFDLEFTKKLKKIRPGWFVSQSELANKKKQKLLEMAKSGKPRPKFSTKLGKFLGEHTTKKELKNKGFAKQLRKLRPDWFVTNAQRNREKLLKIAKLGSKKPPQRTKMGMLLYSYIRRKSEFREKLKKIRPDWFVTRSEIVKMKKRKLLEMAKKGHKRTYDLLGGCLSNYVSKGSGTYDPVFAKEIKKLRPDWFIK